MEFRRFFELSGSIAARSDEKLKGGHSYAPLPTASAKQLTGLTIFVGLEQLDVAIMGREVVVGGLFRLVLVEVLWAASNEVLTLLAIPRRQVILCVTYCICRSYNDYDNSKV